MWLLTRASYVIPNEGPYQILAKSVENCGTKFLKLALKLKCWPILHNKKVEQCPELFENRKFDANQLKIAPARLVLL